MRSGLHEEAEVRVVFEAEGSDLAHGGGEPGERLEVIHGLKQSDEPTIRMR